MMKYNLMELMDQLTKGEIIKANNGDELFYITEVEADELLEIGFYINEINHNSTNEDENILQYKANNNQVLNLLLRS